MAYQASDREKALNIINLDRLEEDAKAILEPGAFGYLQSGAGDQITLRRNREALEDTMIVPRVLADIESPSLKSSLMGIDLDSPVIMAPVAAQGLAHREGEIATTRGVEEAGSIMCLSTYASTVLEEVAAAASTGNWWFQLYMSKDNGINRRLLQRAKANGAKAIILTADATVGGNREADIVNKFTFPLSMPNLESSGQEGSEGKGIGQIYAASKQKIAAADIRIVREYSELPVFVKGIQCPEDAIVAINHGAQGIWVSNHGGRQLDGAPGSFTMLESVAHAVKGRVPVIFDSGIRRGQHVFKALAAGADAVAIGRPAIWGLALGGSKGVASVFHYLMRELAMVMQLTGCHNVHEIRRAERRRCR